MWCRKLYLITYNIFQFYFQPNINTKFLYLSNFVGNKWNNENVISNFTIQDICKMQKIMHLSVWKGPTVQGYSRVDEEGGSILTTNLLKFQIYIFKRKKKKNLSKCGQVIKFSLRRMIAKRFFSTYILISRYLFNWKRVKRIKKLIL